MATFLAGATVATVAIMAVAAFMRRVEQRKRMMEQLRFLGKNL